MPWTAISRTLACICAAAALAACASTDPKTPRLPSADLIAATVQRVFAEARLAGAPQVSVIRQINGQTPGDWMVCLKGDAAQSPLYAIFFQNGQFLSSRPAAPADRCDDESYVPAPSSAPPAPPPPAKKRRGAG